MEKLETNFINDRESWFVEFKRALPQWFEIKAKLYFFFFLGLCNYFLHYIWKLISLIYIRIIVCQ